MHPNDEAPKAFAAGGPDPVVIRKYANRRLYNTSEGCFVTLDDLHTMVKQGETFTVQDARSGQDLTCSILAQIISEEETRGRNLLPLNCLRQILQAYDSGSGPQFRSFLERSMEFFAANQQQVSEQVQNLFGGSPPGDAAQRFIELGRQNVEMFRRSMEWFAPSGTGGWPDDASAPAADGQPRDEEIRQLRQQLADLERRLDDLSRKT